VTLNSDPTSARCCRRVVQSEAYLSTTASWQMCQFLVLQDWSKWVWLSTAVEHHGHIAQSQSCTCQLWHQRRSFQPVFRWESRQGLRKYLWCGIGDIHFCSIRSILSVTDDIINVIHRCRWGFHLPFQGCEPVGDNTTIVCDAWPVRHQIYSLPSQLALVPNKYCLMIDDRGTCVRTACPRLHPKAGRLGVELATCWSQVGHPTYHYATKQLYATQLIIIIN